MSRNLLAAALDYANDPQHAGQGYELELLLTSGHLLIGAVSSAPHHVALIIHQRRTDPRKDESFWEDERTFVDPASIVAIKVVW